MARQLEVTKSDGSSEEYLHTKVLGAINNAFDQIGDTDVFLAQELADVVTYYVYHKDRGHRKRIDLGLVGEQEVGLLAGRGADPEGPPDIGGRNEFAMRQQAAPNNLGM